MWRIEPEHVSAVLQALLESPRHEDYTLGIAHATRVPADVVDSVLLRLHEAKCVHVRQERPKEEYWAARRYSRLSKDGVLLARAPIEQQAEVLRPLHRQKLVESRPPRPRSSTVKP